MEAPRLVVKPEMGYDEAREIFRPIVNVFPPASRRPLKTRVNMGVRIEVEENESIADAIRRFRKRILAEGAFPLYHCKWHKKRHDHFVKPGTLRRRRRWLNKVARKGYKIYSPEPDYDWADDLEFRPRRSQGRLGPQVAT